MSDFYIKTENLYYSYKDEDGKDIPVLKDISLEIKEGEYVAIIGQNGSGKSTLAKLFNMILTPVSGKIYIAGKDITDAKLSEDDIFEVRRDIGMVFQNPDNQLVATIVEEDVAFGPENLGIESKEIRKRVDEALATVGMTEYAGHEPHRLSGGQKQRVAIAGIIAMMPRCMIFDESTAMLDPLGRREVVSTMEKLNKERKITIIHITHYMDEAAGADRVIVLNNGEIFADGTPKEIFSKYEELKSVGLDVPQSTELIYKLKKSGINIDADCMNEDECAKALFDAIKNQGKKSN